MIQMLKNLYWRIYQSSDVNRFWELRQRALHSGGILKHWYRYRYFHLCRKSGASVPLQAEFAGEPNFPHGLVGVFISTQARIGANCTIFHQVTIGSNTLAGTRNPGAPVIGDNVYIGAGAKIIGGVRIGSNVRIGANCVVVTDIPDNSTVVLPAPRIITHDAPRDNRFLEIGQL